MRTKTLLVTAAIGAAGLATSMAQVYSVNAVGYINLTIPNGYHLIANQLNKGGNTLDEVLVNVPDGTQYLQWVNPNGPYNTSIYEDPDGPGGFPGAWNPNLTSAPGGGGFLINSTGGNLPITLVGEVPQGNLVTALPNGYQVVSSQVPQELGIDAMNFPAVDGDQVLRWISSNSSTPPFGNYAPFIYEDPDGPGGFPGAWSPSTPTPRVGESFFVINSFAAKNWTRTFSVNTP